MAKIRICRVLIMEGDHDWIQTTLKNSFINPDVDFICPRGTITEVARLREIVEPDALEVTGG